MRIGHGYDIHIFTPERPLYLGGVKIRETDGLLGHSDADVLIHAIMDSLLGAAGLRDIGYYFPDNDDEYLDIRSTELLKIVIKMITDAGYKIGNIDATVVCEKPKLKNYIEEIRKKLAKTMNISVAQVNLKASTNEKQDSVGAGKSIESFAVCILEEI